MIDRKDIFLDFLSPDNDLLYGASANFASNRDAYVQLLEDAINVAVLLCGQRCLLPPFFPLQSDAVRRALAAKTEYVRSGVIVLPLRETTLDEYFAKKVSEYSRVRHAYGGLYTHAGEEFILQHANAVTRRSAKVGSSLASAWEAGPDVSVAWRPILETVPASAIDTLRKIPLRLKESGESVTWFGIQPFLPAAAKFASFEVNQALQHDYTAVYLAEYDATIVSRLPPKTTDLLLQPLDLSYDYVVLRETLGALRLWPTLIKMRPDDTLRLRDTHGFLQFITAYQSVCRSNTSHQGVKRRFAASAFAVRSAFPAIERHRKRACARLQTSRPLSDIDLEVLDNYLRLIAVGTTRGDLGRERQNHLGANMASVFLVHGHAHEVRDQIELFLRHEGLDVVVMQEAAWSGATIPEKLEKVTETAAFVVIVATPDDHLTLPDGRAIKRLRQNVVLEIGYFWGLLGRHHRFALLLEEADDLDLPSDIAGIGYIRITKDLGETKLRLRKELKEAGVLH